MTPNYKQMPLTVINKYLSDVLFDAGIMYKEITLNGKKQPTIIPAAQTPELNDSGAVGDERQTTFMVYTLVLDEDEQQDWSDCEKMEFTIYAPTVSKILEVIYCFKDSFGRGYSSADEINDWQVSKLAPGEDIYFEFLATSWKVIIGPSATRTEGGRYGAAIELHYEYTYPVTTKPNGSVGKRV